MHAFDPQSLPFDEALAAVRALVPPSPLIAAHDLSERLGREIHLKLENLQVTGSFKVRGAAARMTALTAAERAAGVVTCSSGNHGRAVAWVASQLGVPAVVCVPGWVDPAKLAAIRATGAEARLVGQSYDEAEVEADRIARDDGRTFVHPFDDPHVTAGQATVAIEILTDCPGVAEVLVPLSGGGLAGGMAAAFARAGRPDLVTAVSATAADVMLRSLRAGRPVSVPEEPTLASALAGGIGLDNRVTFPLVRDLIGRHLEVDEDQIRAAIQYGFRSLQVVLEGGGAVGLAGLMGPWVGSHAARRGPVVVVLSGGNLDTVKLMELLSG